MSADMPTSRAFIQECKLGKLVNSSRSSSSVKKPLLFIHLESNYWKVAVWMQHSSLLIQYPRHTGPYLQEGLRSPPKGLLFSCSEVRFNIRLKMNKVCLIRPLRGRKCWEIGGSKFTVRALLKGVKEFILQPETTQNMQLELQWKG